jgi:hypothetical protein
LALQTGDLVAHLYDRIVEEVETGQTGSGLLSLQEPFELEELHGRAYVLDLLVELGTGGARTKMTATTGVFH